ncbi:MAG: helix-turn-helix transcriptional regulator [Bifidobacterium adolescentis]
MSVGENIRRYRKLRGMTQAQLAEAVGLTEGPCATTRAASAL